MKNSSKNKYTLFNSIYIEVQKIQSNLERQKTGWWWPADMGWRESWITKGLKATYENDGNGSYIDCDDYAGVIHMSKQSKLHSSNMYILLCLSKIVPKIRGEKNTPVFRQRQWVA